MKCFNYLVQSAADARRQGDDKLNSNVVAEAMRLLADSSYGYQIEDRCRHSVTRYMNDEKTHATIDNEMFKSLGYINDQL